MKSGKCSKCGQQNVYSTTADERLTKRSEGKLLGISDISVQLYACADCGFYERYLSETESMTERYSFWARVSGANEGPFR